MKPEPEKGKFVVTEAMEWFSGICQMDSYLASCQGEHGRGLRMLNRMRYSMRLLNLEESDSAKQNLKETSKLANGIAVKIASKAAAEGDYLTLHSLADLFEGNALGAPTLNKTESQVAKVLLEFLNTHGRVPEAQRELVEFSKTIGKSITASAVSQFAGDLPIKKGKRGPKPS